MAAVRVAMARAEAAMARAEVAVATETERAEAVRVARGGFVRAREAAHLGSGQSHKEIRAPRIPIADGLRAPCRVRRK